VGVWVCGCFSLTICGGEDGEEGGIGLTLYLLLPDLWTANREPGDDRTLYCFS